MLATPAPRWQRVSTSSKSGDSDRDLWVRGRLALCLKSLAQRMDEQGRRGLEAKWGTEAFSSGESSSPSERDQEAIREISHGTALPSAYARSAACCRTVQAVHFFARGAQHAKQDLRCRASSRTFA